MLEITSPKHLRLVTPILEKDKHQLIPLEKIVSNKPKETLLFYQPKQLSKKQDLFLILQKYLDSFPLPYL